MPCVCGRWRLTKAIASPARIAIQNGHMPMRLKIVSGSFRAGTTSRTPRPCGASCSVIAAEGIGQQRDAGIADADQRQAGFDGAHPGVVGVLGGADRAVEPGVVGDVEDEGGVGRIGAEIAEKIAS